MNFVRMLWWSTVSLVVVKRCFHQSWPSLDRVEIANYGFEIEFYCRLLELGHMTKEAAVAMTRMQVDNQIYKQYDVEKP